MSLSVFIHGGCVSRDVFEFQKDDKFYDIAHYSARCSIGTLAFPKISQQIDLSNLTSNFQSRLVRDDHERNLLKYIKEKDFDLFLIDFNVERCDLINIDDIGFVTNSPEFQKCELSKSNLSKKSIIKSGTDKHFLKFMEGFDTLYNVLKSLNKLDFLFVNKLYWSTFDDEGNILEFSQEFILKINKYLDRIYTALTKKYPNLKFIEYDDSNFVAKTDHKWGLAPYHFVDSLYINTLNKLNFEIKNSIIFSDINIYKKNNLLSVSFHVSENVFSLEYAAYLYYDELVVQKKWYQSLPKFSFNITKKGKYKVRVFCRIKGTKIKNVCYSDEICF